MLEEKHGRIEAVAMEVDNALVITPIFKKEAIVQQSNPSGSNTIEPELEKRTMEGHAYG